MRRLLAWLAVGVAGGCGTEPGPRSTDAEPALVVLLTSGESRHRLIATWTLPADSVAGSFPEARPVGPEELALTLTGPAGARAVPIPDPGNAGIYHFELAVEAGAEYRLTGTVGGIQVSGGIVMPATVALLQPGGDTLRLTDQFPFPEIRYHVRSRGAAAVAFTTPDNEIVGSIGDTVDVWRGPRFHLERGPNLVYVTVYELGGASFLLRRDWATNLTGAVGVLAGRTRKPLTVIVE